MVARSVPGRYDHPNRAVRQLPRRWAARRPRLKGGRVRGSFRNLSRIDKKLAMKGADITTKL
jgi:hypothetical protein